MKIKTYSLLIKAFLILLGLTCCFLKWLNILPNATITEIWASMSMAYGLGLGTIDYNIIFDNIKEHKLQ